MAIYQPQPYRSGSQPTSGPYASLSPAEWQQAVSGGGVIQNRSGNWIPNNTGFTGPQSGGISQANWDYSNSVHVPSTSGSFTPFNGPTQYYGGAQPPAMSFQQYNAQQQPQVGAQTGGVPSYVSPQNAAYYNAVNQGWMQGHGGQSIPQDQYNYFQQRYSEEAGSPNGSHVGDLGYWGMRASGLNEGAPSGGGTLGSMTGSGYSTSNTGPVNSFDAPGLASPYKKEFQPTDINSILSAPAFQAAQANGIDQIQRGAAAKGTLLTGGTLKDLSQWNQGLALGALNDQFNRDATTYGTNRDTFNSNKSNAFNVLNGFANTGLNASGQLGSFGSTYANNNQDNANTAGNLVTNQGANNANAAAAQGANINNTITGGVQAASGIDWSKLFAKKPMQAPTPDPYKPNL